MRAFAAPYVIRAPGCAEETCQRLERAPLSAEGGVSERLVQSLIHQHPALLPIGRLEPVFEDCRPICMELPLPSGFADNLLVTPTGDLVVVETKLWRNPEARRKVVGQILDYAKDLSGFSYSDLEKVVRTARREPQASLFTLAAPQADPQDEAAFIDAVSRNLKRGRMLLVIAGDGIQEGAEQLAAFLQRQASLGFSLAMVELTLWRLGQDLIVIPQVITRTVQIERTVIRLDDGASAGLAGPPDEPAAATLSEDSFYEALEKAEPGLPGKLRTFVAGLEALGIEAVVRRNMMLRRRTEDGSGYNLGAVDLRGRFVTDYANWPAERLGRIDLAHAYQEALAALLPGHHVRQTAKASGWRVVGPDGTEPAVSALLARPGALTDVLNSYGARLLEVACDEGMTGT